MESLAFKMFVNPGQFAEYKRRHDEIWPELKALLLGQGIQDYRIYFDADTHQLFATLSHDGSYDIDALKQHEVMQKWWLYMADIMPAEANNEPKSMPLECVFSLC